MRKGDIIRDYELLGNFTSRNGGHCQWTFARKDGKEYFIKRFLEPVYPVAGSPGSCATKQSKLERCIAFEARHIRVMALLKGKAGDDDCLVAVREFFRDDARYYKVTDKIEALEVENDYITNLAESEQRYFLMTLTGALNSLHSTGLVHGDLKPENVLIAKEKAGRVAARLIDYDHCYLSGAHIHERGDIAGDEVYFSPELGRFFENESGLSSGSLTCKSDIFALGLLFHRYLTGQLPEFERTGGYYAYQAANTGKVLKVSSEIPGGYRRLIECMLSLNPIHRPSTSEIYRRMSAGMMTLEGERIFLPVRIAATGKQAIYEAKPDLIAPGATSSFPPVPATDPDEPACTVSRLRGSLLK